MKFIKATEILYQSLNDEISHTLRKNEAYVKQLAVCSQKCDALMAQLPGGKESDEFTAYVHAISELEDIMQMQIFERGLKLGMKLAKELMEK